MKKNTGNLGIQISCLNCMGSIKGEQAIATLLDYVSHSEWRLSASAIENLGNIGHGIPLGKLLKIPLSSHHEILKHLSRSLGSIGSEKALTRLYDLLNHTTYPIVRQAAAEAIGDIEANSGSKDSLEVLKERAVNEPESSVQQSIADAMKMINHDGGKAFLQETAVFFFEKNKAEVGNIFSSQYYNLVQGGGL